MFSPRKCHLPGNVTKYENGFSLLFSFHFHPIPTTAWKETKSTSASSQCKLILIILTLTTTTVEKIILILHKRNPFSRATRREILFTRAPTNQQTALCGLVFMQQWLKVARHETRKHGNGKYRPVLREARFQKLEREWNV